MYNFSFNLFIMVSVTLSHLFAEFDYVTVPAGAYPSVSAEDGGNGFEEIAESLEYQTATFTADDLKYFGDPKAVKGGTLRRNLWIPSIEKFSHLSHCGG